MGASKTRESEVCEGPLAAAPQAYNQAVDRQSDYTLGSGRLATSHTVKALFL